MRALPLLLIYLRLLLGGLVLLLAVAQPPGFGGWAVALTAAGLVSDVLDGIVARHLGVSTEKLRRLDSAVDQLFWVLVAVAAFVAYPGFFRHHGWPLAGLLGLEAATYVLSYLRFGREVATHSLGAKLWTLTIFATLAEVLLTGDSRWAFRSCLLVGVVSRLEILGILSVLPGWTNDVPTLYHALRLRRGLPIRRHRLLNG
jgi:CDP-diacylglycerol--glycerol-3-phosphate 3-phosphatidyltransferase